MPLKGRRSSIVRDKVNIILCLPVKPVQPHVYCCVYTTLIDGIFFLIGSSVDVIEHVEMTMDVS